MIRVLIETPFAGDTQEEIEENIKYARACMSDCLKRGEAPFASHLLYTQPGILEDSIPEERKLGIEAGLLWGEAATFTIVYIDRGVSEGMEIGINRAIDAGRPVIRRELWKSEDRENNA
jgi:hypothetical protein